MSRRVLRRLEQAEACELNPQFCDDYRIAWITVMGAWRGSPLPHTAATYVVLGLHPEKVWPAVVARRHAALGQEYAVWYDANGNLQQQSPPVLPGQEAGTAGEKFAFARRGGRVRVL